MLQTEKIFELVSSHFRRGAALGVAPLRTAQELCQVTAVATNFGQARSATELLFFLDACSKIIAATAAVLIELEAGKTLDEALEYMRRIAQPLTE